MGKAKSLLREWILNLDWRLGECDAQITSTQSPYSYSHRLFRRTLPNTGQKGHHINRNTKPRKVGEVLVPPRVDEGKGYQKGDGRLVQVKLEDIECLGYRNRLNSFLFCRLFMEPVVSQCKEVEWPFIPDIGGFRERRSYVAMIGLGQGKVVHGC